MEVNWIAIGWIIDMILNGIVWVIIAAFSLLRGIYIETYDPKKKEDIYD